MDTSNTHQTQPSSLPEFQISKPPTLPSSNSPAPKYIPRKTAIILLVIIGIVFVSILLQIFV